MQIESIIYRIAVMPTRHYLAAGAMAAALGFGAWFGVRHMPAEYLGSALLSYQSPGQFLADSATSESDVPTARIAGSILTPTVLAKLADQTHFTTDATPSSRHSNAGDARLDAFRSHIDVEQSGPGLLRVTYRGNDPQQVTASANALAAAIAAWVPKPVAGPQVSPQPPASPVPSAPQHLVAAAAPVAGVAATTPAPIAPKSATGASQPAQNAAQLEHRAAALQEDLATLELQRQEIDSRLQSLAAEQKHPKRSASNTAAGSDDAAAGRSRLKAVAKEVTSLRILRSSLVEQLQDGKQRFEVLKAQALGTGPSSNQPSIQASAAPAAAAAPAPINTAARQSQSATATVPAAVSQQDTPAIADPLKEEDAREQRSWQGAFTVLSWSDKSYALEDDRNQILQIGGIVTAILFPVIYLVLVAWRFRPVSNAASLRRVLPRGMKYYGSVSGTPISEKTS